MIYSRHPKGGAVMIASNVLYLNKKDQSPIHQIDLRWMMMSSCKSTTMPSLPED